MTVLVHAALYVRRTARAGVGYAAAVALAAGLLVGVFTKPTAPYLTQIALAIGWSIMIGWKWTVRPKRDEGGAIDLDLGLLLLVAVYSVVELAGGLSSPFYPLVYIAVAFFASFTTTSVSSMLVLAAIALESGLYFLTEGRTELRPFGIHVGFIVFFGALNFLLTRAEIVRVRGRSRREIAEQRERARDESRLFRLVTPSSSDTPNEELLHQSSVDEVHHALYHILQLLHRTLGLHTCVLLMPSETDGKLHIAELVSASDNIADGPFTVGGGAVGAAVKRAVVTNLQHLKLGYRGICYYRGPALVQSFIAAPVLERDHLRAVLCADRLDDQPFNENEEDILRNATGHILRALENERVFVQLERSKREQSILYRSSQALGTAVSQDAVIEAGLHAAKDIVEHDFAALTEFDPTTRRHVIRRVVGDQAERFHGLKFRDNASLTAMVIKNRHYLPYRGDFDPTQQVLFTRRANLKSMRSLLTMPLIVREEPIGTLVLAAHRPAAFGDSVRATLQVLTNQLAAALANAAAVKRLEEMATTDGLTGCLNKRAFLEEMDKKMAAAQRFGRKLSLIVADLDHFKSINDTYGHATGDRVIRETGEALHAMKRETDVVGRFGGEEFCILCEETDTRGATQLAERLRIAIEEKQVHTDLGVLKVTASLGVATFPEHARDAEDLFEVSDRALYHAKHSGRNQVRRA